MRKALLWIVAGCVMALSLVFISCSQNTAVTQTSPTIQVTTKTEQPTSQPTQTTTSTATATQETQQGSEATSASSDKPQYGGTLRLVLVRDNQTWDDVLTFRYVPGITMCLTNDTLWQGDWAKGNAGGYGTKETDWLNWYDVFDQKAPMAATDWKWYYDDNTSQGVLVYHIRQGMHWSLDPNNPASVLVGGREVTVKDVIFSLKQVTTDPRAYMYHAYPELDNADIEQTGPWEITIKVPKEGLITAVAKFGAYVRIVPPEVVAKYGDMSHWQQSVGSGPFILTDWVSESGGTLVKNPNYWATNPVGPGKGDKIPYIDGIQYLVIPDASTQQAALRTGKIDRDISYSYDDAQTVLKQAPDILSGPGILSAATDGPQYIYMNSQKAPFDNVKVRQALLMATDLNSIKDSFNHGLGQILTWPVEYVPAYKDIYLGLDDPEMPQAVKDLYTYNPDKAKQLLADAGYPNGFKATALIINTESDYFSVIKAMWAKIGVDLSLDVEEQGAGTAIYHKGDYDIVGFFGGRGPLSVFYHMVTLVGHSPQGGSGSNIQDATIDAASVKMQDEYLNDYQAAAKTFKDSMKYVLAQAYVIPRPIYPLTNFWWPWLKNYSGEYSVGYIRYDSWAQWVWIDQALKKSMGY